MVTRREDSSQQVTEQVIPKLLRKQKALVTGADSGSGLRDQSMRRISSPQLSNTHQKNLRVISAAAMTAL